MNFSSFFLYAFAFLALPALLSTSALYLYPVLFACRFPTPDALQPQYTFDQDGQAVLEDHAAVAPFRLLALGDPQLEGDSSLPDPDDPLFPSLVALGTLQWDDDFKSALERAQHILRDLVYHDVPSLLKAYRKRLDLLGNDYYLAHIYRTMHWWSDPTHVTVLGDLIGSQWVSDDEFEERGQRFWNRVFKDAEKVDDSISGSSRIELLGQDTKWKRRLINPAGNHDIGYAGDITPERRRRFEAMYGRLNWDITFRLPTGLWANESETGAPDLHVAVINSMNLDYPTSDEQAQDETYKYINNLITRLHPVEDRRSAVLLLTHIPLFKEDGICVDGPFFTYSDTGIQEQNHLSRDASRTLLESIFGMSADSNAPAQGLGRNGLIINGHDHEGCDTLHSIEQSGDAHSVWQAQRYDESLLQGMAGPHLREITARSMMGMYDGFAYLVSAWFDIDAGEWRFESSTCRVGVQHIWWAVHVVDLITILVFIAACATRLIEMIWSASPASIPIRSSSSGPASSSALKAKANTETESTAIPSPNHKIKHKHKPAGPKRNVK